jgi:hypothetical protein
MSRVVIPREYSDSTTELMFDSRVFLGTITGSKDPLRSRGASMVTRP